MRRQDGIYKFTNKRNSREICEWTLDSGKIESVVEIIGNLAGAAGKWNPRLRLSGNQLEPIGLRISRFQFVTTTRHLWNLDIQGQWFHNLIVKNKHQRGQD